MTYSFHVTEHELDHTIIESRDPLIGHVLDGRFRIDVRLAVGGFGAIYRAADLQSGLDVALKVLHANLAADPLVAARFRREGATLASLRDPHTVTAFAVGEASDGTMYIAMELLRGETLFDAYRRHGGPLPWRRVTAIARAVCSSLAEAHERGIVHRDLKPANIHLQAHDGDGDLVKVLDFGIAKILQGSDLDAQELTVAGQLIGTSDYMAPEQILGGVVGPHSDIYTLGVVMYEMIAGRLPYAGAASPTQMIAMLLTSAPTPLAERVPVPPALDRIVMRCLERESQDRFADVAELAAALDLVLGGGVPEEATLISATQPSDSGPQTRTTVRSVRTIESIDVRAQGSQPAIVQLPPPRPRPHTGAPRPHTSAPRSHAGAPRSHAGAPRSHAGAPRSHTSAPRPHAGAPRPHAGVPRPYVDPRARPLAVGAPWQQPPHARRQTEGPSFDAARDATVRNIVWALVIVLGCALALIVAKSI